MRLIITCGCGDTTEFAKDAFKILFPDEEIPDIVELNSHTRSLIKMFMLTLEKEEAIDKFLDSKFAIAIDVMYQLDFDIITGEYSEGFSINVKDLIKGCDLELC